MDNEAGKGRVVFRPPYLPLLGVIVVAAAALVIFFYLQGSPAVALVNGEKITKEELYEAMYAKVGRDTLEELIIRRLIYQEAKRLGITVSDEEVDEEIQRIIREHFMGVEAQFLAVLEQYGWTLEMVREDTRVNMLALKIARSQVEVTDDEAREYFAENRSDFDFPDEVEARHILVDTEEEALEILALLQQGGDFEELARERSQDPGSKDKGGYLGFFTAKEMDQNFAEAAFGLSPGEISPPVKSFYGFHIIEVLDYREGRSVTFEEVKEEVREKIIEEKSSRLLHEILMRLREKAHIDIRGQAP